jgi:predicted dehydrogenase
MILRTIHVGVGGRGQALLDVMGADPKFRPVALVDSNSTHAKVAQYKLTQAGHKSVPVFSGLAGPLSQLEADAMIIATPIRPRAEICRMALTVNQHILTDSPIVPDLGQLRQLVAEADSAWLKFCAMADHRYSAIQQTVAYLLNSPNHPHYPGQVKLVDYVFQRHHPEQGTQDYPNAAIWETAGQHMDTLAWWLGPVKRVTARSYAAPWTHWIHDPNLSAFIEYETGALCNYVLTNDATVNHERITLQGDRGALVLTDHVHLAFYGRPVQGAELPDVQEVEILDTPRPEQAMVDEFFRYIVEDVEPGISGKHHLAAMTVCEMLIRSGKNKKPVERVEIS